MFNRLLSADLPRSRVLTVILVAVFLGLLFAPFIFPGVKALNVAAKVLVFVVLVASFDLLRAAVEAGADSVYGPTWQLSEDNAAVTTALTRALTLL